MNDWEKNPPAFPIPASDLAGAYMAASGMTMREYFASHAPVSLQDAVAVCGWDSDFIPRSDDDRTVLWAVMVMLRYEYADAMIMGYRNE